MSVQKVIKERRKFYREIQQVPLARETFLFTDSKGSDIKDILPTSVENKFHVIFKSGAMVFDKKHISTLTRRVREIQESVVLIWMGTCEITQKKGKYIKRLDYPYQNIEFILTEYRNTPH